MGRKGNINYMQLARLSQNRQKYGNTKIETSEGTFDSKAEESRYNELILLEKAGKIKDLQRQRRFELIPKQEGEKAVNYIADFVYVEDGRTIVEDVKSVATAKDKAYIIKRKAFKWRYPEHKFVETIL